MKKFMMMVAMAFATLTASAQAEAGTLTLKPMVGISVSDISGSDANADSKVGVAAGAELGYQLNETFALSVGAVYSMQGGKGKISDLKTEYINIPILAHAYIAKGFAVQVGVQPGFIVKDNLDDLKALDDTPKDAKLKSFDFSIPLGLSYEFSNFVIDARYNWGLTNIYDNFDGKNSVMQFTIGYKFAL